MVNLHHIQALQRIDVDKNVYLRPMENEDSAEMLAVLAADPSIAHSVTAAANIQKENGVVEEVTRYKNDEGLIRYSIVCDNKVIGLMSLWSDDGFFNTEPIPNGYGFGYFLHPNFRGKGIVSRSLLALMSIVQNSVPVDCFMAFCEDKNEASKAVLQKLDFSPTDETFEEPNNGWIERRYIKKT